MHPRFNLTGIGSPSFRIQAVWSSPANDRGQICARFPLFTGCSTQGSPCGYRKEYALTAYLHAIYFRIISSTIVTTWNFLTNHGRALLCIAHDPGRVLRDIAATLGITERRAHGIVTGPHGRRQYSDQDEGRKAGTALHVVQSRPPPSPSPTAVVERADVGEGPGSSRRSTGSRRRSVTGCVSRSERLRRDPIPSHPSFRRVSHR